MKRIKSVGVVGCGAIGTTVAQYIQKELSHYFCLAVLCDRDRNKAEDLKNLLKSEALVSDDPGQCVDKADIVVEAAATTVVPDLVKQVLNQNKQLMVLSVGGLLSCLEHIQAYAGSGAIHVPSGALAGIDALQAAAVGQLDSVELITKKPVKGLVGAPYLVAEKINLEAIKQETIVFEGSAEQAIQGFPKNINVSVILSLAGLGPAKTKVKIITAPDWTTNSHQVVLKGSSGDVITQTINVPDPTNPKTSFLAALSACALLKKIAAPLKLGT